MKKIIVPVIIMLLYSFSLWATEPLVEFDFLIAQNNSVILYTTRAFFGTPDQKIDSSNYALHIYDREKNLLVDTYLPVYFIIPDPLEEVSETYTSIKLPYLSEYDSLEIINNQKKIYQHDISLLCHKDNYCQHSENYASCPADCSSGNKDRLCDKKSDGRCDPDCRNGDLDCQVKWKGDNIEKRISWVVISAILLFMIISILILYLASRRKKHYIIFP